MVIVADSSADEGGVTIEAPFDTASLQQLIDMPRDCYQNKLHAKQTCRWKTAEVGGRKYSPWFKREAIALTCQPGVSCRQFALEIGINPNLLVSLAERSR